MNKITLASTAAILAMSSLATPVFAVTPPTSGFLALEGSDATSFHQDSTYGPQLFKYLQGASALPVLIYNQSGTYNIDASTGHVNAYTTSLASINLSNYSALYIQTPGTCCTADNTTLNGYGAAVNAFRAAGGNVAIGNYVGGDFDGVVVGWAGSPAGVIEGYTAMNGGVGGGPSCSDGEIVTALGISKGFTQPPVDGCWSHQAYDNSYWSTFGYVDLMHADPAYTFRNGGNNGSSFLALGGTLGHNDVPEPAAWALMIVGFGMVGGALRRRAMVVTA